MTATAFREQTHLVYPRWNGDGDVKELTFLPGIKAVSNTRGYDTILVNGKTILYDKRQFHCEREYDDGRVENAHYVTYVKVVGQVVGQEGLTRFVKDLRRDDDTDAIGNAIANKESAPMIVFGAQRK